MRLIDHVRPGLVDQLAEPFEVRGTAGAAGVADVGGDVAAGELQVGLAKRGEGFEGLVIRGLVSIAARVGQRSTCSIKVPMGGAA